ncbi:site-specific DNA-methyltransferase [bacterium]|nr:site-specific DNA-methyltransferase [bacterium]
MPRGNAARKIQPAAQAKTYKYPNAKAILRPDAGVQSQFRKKKPPKTYRYDSSLSPALDWDDNPARELGEWLIHCIEQASRLEPPHRFPKIQEFKDAAGNVVATVSGLHDAVEQLKRLSKPFLNWAGKAERLSFDVPTLPLFIHERLSTKAILETIKGHKRDKQLTLFDLFADREHPIQDQLLRAYEHANGWTNRMILGDSLIVMNSLLQYEGLGGQVQMIYMDPPYGVEFGSNFQPFVRKREVKHNDDINMTREPEMVKAYRDTWELALHSYLTYLRDRLLLCRDLLLPSGSIFVQMGDENLHHVREVMDQVFGEKNFISLISIKTSPGDTTDYLPPCLDYLLWYAKDISRTKFRKLYLEKSLGVAQGESFDWIELADGSCRLMTEEESRNSIHLPAGSKPFRWADPRRKGSSETAKFEYEFEREIFTPGPGMTWKTSPQGLDRLKECKRLGKKGKQLNYKRYLADFPCTELLNVWIDTMNSFLKREYVVETNPKIVQRCMLMTTDPGDLVFDPTCGSGTTAYVSEQWGRRWITIDTSRVPLALARQQLLTATFPYYELKDETLGPAGGFVYKRKQNRKGEEVGGIVPHITLESIANNEPPKEEVLVDRPEKINKITRVTGPFTVEATIPTPVDWENDNQEDSKTGNGESHRSFVDRMLEVLRKSPVLQVGGGKTVTLSHVRPPAKTLALSAEALVETNGVHSKSKQPNGKNGVNGKNGQHVSSSQKLVAIVFGPENGAVSEKLVFEAAREAHAKSYTHLYVIGFAIQPNARELIEKCEAAAGVAATYVQATPDLMMGDLLKNMRSSQIFSVCGLPEIKVHETKPKQKGEPVTYQVELLGLDVFDPIAMESKPFKGSDVPAWFLDIDYNGLCFHVSQAFFPRTAAWDDLRRALRTQYEDSVWDHLAGTLSTHFEAGEHRKIAVKVIDDRGNELLMVTDLEEKTK